MSRIRPCTILAGAVAAGFVLLYGFVPHADDRDHMPPSRPAGPVPDRETHTRYIGLVGDSWVADGRLETPLRAAFEKLGIEVECRSEGFRGADSRRIREELFRQDPRTGGPLGLLSNPEIRLIVVIGGVNDVLEHRGPERYATEMLRLAAETADWDIRTCIVEIARFGQGTEPKLSRVEHLLRSMRKLLYEDRTQDPVSRYRAALRERLKRNPQPSVHLIDPDPAIPDYTENKDLYSNAYHLNAKGDSVLAGLIAGSLSDFVAREKPCTRPSE